jgi:NAD(P)-dependent dehydrogenase (short-subunit alcohol dehydrogenase family)
MGELTGKTILVTGAAKGIGRAAAAEALREGATVIGADVDQALLNAAAANTGLDPLALDVTSPDMWREVERVVRSRHKRLDGLVNNAGIILNRPFLETSLEDLRQVNAINLEGPWLGMQTFAPLLSETAKGLAGEAETKGSSIVNLSSIYGIVAGPMHAAYCASKGAVRLLTKSAALEFAASKAGIRVNSVHPGPVNTDLARSALDEYVARGRIRSVEEAAALQAAGHLQGRIAEVDDIVGAIVFLLSDRSSFMTGTETVIDGGETLR